ncbi:hypothetical protein BC833DRAFT_572318 [Globomyces pollinis-pini]|nr:hypothetical protein BC833DRAFT_572318 [Globomyces pollinis-pini]
MASNTPLLNQIPSTSIDFSSRLWNVAENITLCTLAGGSVGSIYAKLFQKSIAVPFYSLSNSFSLSAPFFIGRELVLQYRYWRNERLNFKNIQRRDWDEFLASTISGAVVGGGLGYSWRGPLAILPVGLVYSGLMATLQSGVLVARNYRVSVALSRLEGASAPESQSTTPIKEHWKDGMFRIDSNKGIPSVTGIQNFDPAGLFYMSIQNTIAKLVDNPKTYWTRAVDLEYRQTLNIKITILQDQIIQLKADLEKKNRLKVQ